MLKVFVVSNLSKPRERVILSQGMALKPIVCEKAIQVWVIQGMDSKHIPVLTLGPLGTRIQINHTRKRLMVIHKTDHLKAVFQGIGKELVHHTKPEGCSWSINHVHRSQGGVLKTFLISKVPKNNLQLTWSKVNLKVGILKKDSVH